MSDSEEDKPLAARALPPKQLSTTAANVSSSAAGRTGEASTSAARDPLQRRATQKAPVIDESDSEDDKPLGARTKPAKPAARPGSGGAVKKAPAVKKELPKGRAAAVKDEPLSPDVKSEPESSPQKPARSKPVKVKKAEGEKRVIVKKEFDMPGQTRDTPSEADPLHKFYTSLRQQRPDSEMAKKWCLIHGLLDMEEAEQLVAELKLKKGQLRSPGKPVNGTTARKGSTAAARKPADSSSKLAAKRKAKRMLSESDQDKDSFEFLAPSKKIQKQGSGANASSKAKAAPNGLTKTASTAQAGKDRPSSGGARSNSAGGSGKPSVKPRPLVASTTKDKAFADGGLDPISDDSDDDKPLGRRLTKPIA